MRVVPHAVARYGAYIAPGAILMPSYVNIGAYVDTGTMVDTWATVRFLRPDRQTRPPLGRRGHRRRAGTRAGRAGHHRGQLLHRLALHRGRGAHVCREAVLGSNTVITGSTHIIDVTGPEPVTYKGYVPPRSVVVPGSYRKQFPAGEYSVTCALIIGRRKESTDKKNLAERRPARLRRIGIDMIHRIEETTSTNDDARDAKYRHGDIVRAERQTAGAASGA